MLPGEFRVGAAGVVEWTCALPGALHVPGQVCCCALMSAPLGSGHPQIAASGPNVYVAWSEGAPFGSGEIFFKASNDGGLTFTAQNLSSNVTDSSFPQIAVWDRMSMWCGRISSGKAALSDKAKYFSGGVIILA